MVGLEGFEPPTHGLGNRAPEERRFLRPWRGTFDLHGAWVHPKTPAAKLIEGAGLKGKRIGGASVSKIHANFILNLGKAKAEDVLTLVKAIKEEVKRKTGIDLEPEIEIWGED